MGLFLSSTQMKRVFASAAIFIALFALFFLVTVFIFQNIFKSQVETSLYKLTERIKNDLRFINGKWDTSLYNADPLTPHPTGSSGFITPLYIITTDGFVIERNQRIRGLLDTSDYKRLITFSSPQTINGITNEKWRVYSKPIAQGTNIYGVAMVSFFNPVQTSQAEIDEKLERNLNTLLSLIEFSDSTIKTNKLDARDIDYDVSFEVVDTFNKVLINNGRTPSFIDPSYVNTMIKNKSPQIIRDSDTGENFYVVSQTLYDKSNMPRALVVAGESIDFIYNGIWQYLPYAIGMTLIGTALGIVFIRRTFNIRTLLKQAEVHEITPQTIIFLPKAGELRINEETVDIPTDSHQFKLIQALFSKPSKLWNQEDLLEYFHESGNQENSRKIYDAMLAVNKKTGFKLILYKDKTYRIEPSLITRITVQ